MKKAEVPQHQGLFGHRRAVCYAMDETGDYRLLPTAGWDPVNLANRQAWEEIAAQLAEILRQSKWKRVKHLWTVARYVECNPVKSGTRAWGPTVGRAPTRI